MHSNPYFTLKINPLSSIVLQYTCGQHMLPTTASVNSGVQRWPVRIQNSKIEERMKATQTRTDAHMHVS